MTLPVKLGAGVLAVGSTIGAGYGGMLYFTKKDEPIIQQQKTTIDKLIKDKFQYILLNTTEGDSSNPDKSHWDTVWADYVRENGTGTDVFKLEGWADRGSNNLTEKLKKKCSELWSSEILDEQDALYGNVTKYCSRAVTIADEAKNDGLEVIKTGDSSADNLR